MQHFCHQNNVYTAFLVMFQWCWTLYDCMISLMYNVQLRSEPQSSRLKGACWLSFFPSIYSLYLSCCAARSRPIVYLINGTYYFTSFFLNFRTDDWVAFLRTVVKHTGVRQPVFKQHSAAHSHSHSISGCKHLQEISNYFIYNSSCIGDHFCFFEGMFLASAAASTALLCGIHLW